MQRDKKRELTPSQIRLRKIRYDPYNAKIQEYFEKAKAPGTVKLYLAAFERCEIWAKELGIEVLPMDVDDLMSYLIYLSENIESYAATKMARYGISYVHVMAGVPDPTKDPAVDLIMEAARRMWARPVKKAKAMTTEIIRLLVDEVLGQDVYRKWGTFKVSMTEWRTVVSIIIKFCFVARNSDVLELRMTNFVFVKDLLHINFPKAKNDQFHEGSTTTFERQRSKYCPVYLAAKYFERLGYGQNSKGFFLPKIQVKRAGRVRGQTIYTQKALPDQHISYSTCLIDRRKILERLGLPSKQFSEHSDRIGGVSHLLNNGATIAEAQVHGRWKSDKTTLTYVQRSEQKKRELSRLFFKKK